MVTKLENREVELLILCLSLALIISGVILNYKAIVSNDCKMPVPKGEYNVDMNDKHFFFESKEDVNYYYLTDIITFYGEALSIGDLKIIIILTSPK